MKRHLNLIPWKRRCRLLLRERLRQWCVVWTLSLCGAVVFGWWEWQRLAASEEALETWQRRSEPIRVVESSNQQLQNQIQTLQNRLAKYGHFEAEQAGFHLVATISQSANQCLGKIQVQRLTFKTSQVTDALANSNSPAGKAAQPTVRNVRSLSLSGVAATNLAVAQFVSALRDSATFQTVELKSSQGKGEVASGPRTYQIECSF